MNAVLEELGVSLLSLAAGGFVVAGLYLLYQQISILL